MDTLWAARGAWWRGALAALGVLIAGAVGAQERVPIRLQLKWQHEFQFAGYYAAKAQGYYDAAGLDVDIREAGPDQEVIPRVLDGRADFGVWNSSLLLDRQAGAPVVVLAVIFQHSALALAARDDGRIASLHDLAGKSLMIDPAAAEIYAYLKREGLDRDRFVQVAPSQKLEDMFGDGVDAFTLYTTSQTYFIQRLGRSYHLYSPRSAGIDFYGDNLFTTEAYIKAHPERVRAFLEASLKGWDYAMAHPREIAELIALRYNASASVEQLLFEAEAMRPLMVTDLLGVGHMHPGRWQHIAEVYTELGLLKPGFDLEGFLYDPNPHHARLQRLYKALAGFGVVVVLLAVLVIYVSRSNRRQAASLKRQRIVFNNAPVAFIVADAAGTILDWNRAAEEIFGWTLDEVRGRPISVLVPPDERGHVLEVLHTASEQDVPTHLINRNVTRDGREILCQWQNARYFDDLGQPLGTLSVGLDVTARHALEVELRESRDVAEKLAAELQEMLADQRQFLSMLSHEVRVPLAVIDSNCELLELHTELAGRPQTAVDRIRRGVARLAGFFDNCLTVDRLENRGLTLQRSAVDLDSFLPALVEHTHLNAAGQRVDLQNDAPGTVLSADAHLLEVLLGNLLDNGLKYSPVGAAVCLRFTRDGDDGVFTVRDSGIGIPAEDLSRVTQKFQRGRNASQVSGAGLGLTLATRIVALHGGRLHLESTFGVGTCVTVRLPLAAAERGA